jgi:putative peptidoglycan lipid II flippase
VLILGALASSFFSAFGIIPLVAALPVAGVFQMILMWRMLKVINKTPRWGFWPKISTAGKAMWKKFFAAAMSQGGMQLNLLIDTILASTMTVGAISSLYYADRIAQLPLGVIGVALGTALLPRLSRLEAAGDDAEVRAVIARGLRVGMFFALPSMVGAILLADPVIRGLFGYGEFKDFMISPTANVLVAYAIGIPAFIMSKIFQPAFFAANDPKTPLRIAMVTVVFNLVASLILMRVLGVVGLALATSLASWFSVCIMIVILHRRNRINRQTYSKTLPIILATAAMAGGIILFKPVFDNKVMYEGFMDDTFGLLMMVAISVVIYFAAGFLLGAIPRDFRQSMK